ncbi:MAG: hypothetical protein WBC40_02015 [Halobacteriota archaeon]
MKKDKNLLDVVKSSLKVLEDDISFLRDFDVSLPSEISNFLERMNSRYASAIEKIVREDESGYSDLEDILVSVNETRLQQYQKAAKSMLQMTRKELKSAFWFRDQFSLSQRIDDIEKRILEIDSSLTSKEPTEIEKSINLYKDQINALGGIQNSFQWERHRSRLGISLKVLFWSFPILIGIWISGKFDNSTIFAFIVIIFLSAALSYLFVGSKRFEGVISQNKVILIISLFVLIAVIFLWMFYTPISSYFNINFELKLGILAMILSISGMMLIVFSKNIPETLAKRNFVVVISTIDKNFSPEDEIVIPYSLENKRSGVITEIGVSIFAPGLSVISEGKNILYKSMGGKSTENGELKLLQVPKETVPGEYTVELNWSFYVGSEKYMKTDKIKVNVVS